MAIKTRDNSNSLIQSVRQLLRQMSRKRRRQLGILVLLMLVSSLSEMISLGAIIPFLEALSNPDMLLNSPIWQPWLASAQINSHSQLVNVMALFFVVTVVIANSLRLITLNAQVRLSAAIGSDLSSQVYRRSLQQPYSFHLQSNSSDLMQTVVDDTNRLSSNVLLPLLSLLTDGVLALSLIGALVIIDGRIAISAAIFLGSIYAFIYRFRKNLLRKNSKIISQVGQAKIKAVQEGLGGVRDVLIANTQDFFQDAYEKSERSLRYTQAKNNLIAKAPTYLVEAITMSSIAILALVLGRNGDFTRVVPILGSLALGAKRLLPALQSFFGSLALIQGAQESLVRILIASQRPIDPLMSFSASNNPLFLEKELCFENVWFRYSDETDWVLKGLNLEIKAKTTVAFVGSTGSGKSTTADLILGLLRPQQGKIWVDRKPLEDERLRQWQQGVAHVPQSIFLTDASIAENIAFAVPKEEINLDKVCEAARLAQVDDFIRSLPAGYNTYVGERGIRLSGGQRQRIGIARALYRQATVIVFDEATSALDNVTEKEVMDSINRLSRQFTIILIAHRMSTVKKCDLIFELHHGQVAARGTYQELQKNSFTFRQMTSIEPSKLA